MAVGSLFVFGGCASPGANLAAENSGEDVESTESEQLSGAEAGEDVESMDGNESASGEADDNNVAFKSTARLRPGLSVVIAVFVAGVPEVNETTKRVPDEGIITLPLIGNVNVDGLTLGELADQLTKKYGEFFIHPHVIAQFVLDSGSDGELTASPWGFVTVLGRVARQGKVAIPPTQDMTVSTAIQRAGGLASSAKDSAIAVTRKKEDGETEKLIVDLKAMGRRGAVDEDIRVKAGDVIFVPEEIF